jgi:phage gpG-like protein
MLDTFISGFLPGVAKGMNIEMGIMANIIKVNKLSGQVLKRRSGRLASSIRYWVKLGRNKIHAAIGSDVEYAAIHETGGIIRPKRARWLTIPFPGAMTQNRRYGHVRGRARTFSDTFIKRSQRGNLIIFQDRGSEIVPLFILKKRVRIPKRPYMEPAIRARMPRMQHQIFRELNKAWAGIK